MTGKKDFVDNTKLTEEEVAGAAKALREAAKAVPTSGSPAKQMPPIKLEAKKSKSAPLLIAARVERAVATLDPAERVMVLRFCLEAAAIDNQKAAYQRLATTTAPSTVPPNMERIVNGDQKPG